MKRFAVCLSVVFALAILATAAQAQIVETAMRGNTVVASPSLSTGWAYNPATLSVLGAADPDALGMAGWKHAGSVDLEVSGDTDLFALNWGGGTADKGFGLGAGYWDTSWSDVFGVGFGKSWRKDMAWGVTWRRIDLDGPGGVSLDSVSNNSDNLFDVGLAGESSFGGAGKAMPFKWGLVVRDITDELQLTIDIGAAAYLPGGILVAVDLADLTDEVDSALRVGAAKRFGMAQEWEIGVGLDDGNLTLGALYDSKASWGGAAWKIGGAWMDADGGDDSLLAGAYGTWGW